MFTIPEPPQRLRFPTGCAEFDSKNGSIMGHTILVANRAVHERRRPVSARSGALPAIASLLLLKRRSCLSLVCAAS